MKTLFTTIALLVSLVSFSQDSETMVMRTDSIQTPKSKGANPHVFYFIEGAMRYGKTTTDIMDKYYTVKSVTYVKKDNIYVYELNDGYMLHINKDENTVIVLYPWGSEYKYY